MLGDQRAAASFQYTRDMNWRAAIGVLLVPLLAIGGWYLIQSHLIDSEVSYEPFAHEGNLVKDNPGLVAGVWHLVYEEPGSPARTVPLVFDHDSRCGSESMLMMCNISFEQGERVRIEGVIAGDAVRVQKLLYLGGR